MVIGDADAASHDNVHFRPITAEDIEPLFELRAAVRENALTRAELAAMGITPQETIAALGGELAGCLCVVADRIGGFAMSNLRTREIAVIAVLPEFEGRGIGRELLRLAEEILWERGTDPISLWTWPDRTTRAVFFYRKCGWTEQGVKDGRLYFTKSRPSVR